VKEGGAWYTVKVDSGCVFW